MTDTNIPPEESNRRVLNKLIFDQNLDEAHLLIDFISGRANRSLDSLAIPGIPSDTHQTGTPPLSSREVIERVTRMRFPPDQRRGEAAIAEDAAILLMAKDSLSRLAEPARGLTIAYTAMFIGEEVASLVPWPRWKTAHDVRVDTRIDLAVAAFPLLQFHAHKFRKWRDALALFSLVWLIFTAIAYWDAGLGRASLERLDVNWKTWSDQVRDDPTLQDCPDAAKHTTAADPKVAGHELACLRHAYRTESSMMAAQDVQDVFECKGLHRLKIFHAWCWHWLLSGKVPKQSEIYSASNDHDKRIYNATYWQWATSKQTVFTTYMLPMMFALLGTLISAFRAILDRVRDSMLAPRDFVRMMLGIPAGLVAGVAVGLFLSPSSVPIQGAGGVAGQLTLTASGLGFLAGYASHSFYTYLDTVIRTVFPAGAVEHPTNDLRPSPQGAVRPAVPSPGTQATLAPSGGG